MSVDGPTDSDRRLFVGLALLKTRLPWTKVPSRPLARFARWPSRFPTHLSFWTGAAHLPVRLPLRNASSRATGGRPGDHPEEHRSQSRFPPTADPSAAAHNAPTPAASPVPSTAVHGEHPSKLAGPRAFRRPDSPPSYPRDPVLVLEALLPRLPGRTTRHVWLRWKRWNGKMKRCGGRRSPCRSAFEASKVRSRNCWPSSSSGDSRFPSGRRPSTWCKKSSTLSPVGISGVRALVVYRHMRILPP